MMAAANPESVTDTMLTDEEQRLFIREAFDEDADTVEGQLLAASMHLWKTKGNLCAATELQDLLSKDAELACQVWDDVRELKRRSGKDWDTLSRSSAQTGERYLATDFRPNVFDPKRQSPTLFRRLRTGQIIDASLLFQLYREDEEKRRRRFVAKCTEIAGAYAAVEAGGGGDDDDDHSRLPHRSYMQWFSQNFVRLSKGDVAGIRSDIGETMKRAHKIRADLLEAIRNPCAQHQAQGWAVVAKAYTIFPLLNVVSVGVTPPFTFVHKELRECIMCGAERVMDGYAAATNYLMMRAGSDPGLFTYPGIVCTACAKYAWEDVYGYGPWGDVPAGLWKLLNHADLMLFFNEISKRSAAFCDEIGDQAVEHIAEQGTRKRPIRQIRLSRMDCDHDKTRRVQKCRRCRHHLESLERLVGSQAASNGMSCSIFESPLVRDPAESLSYGDISVSMFPACFSCDSPSLRGAVLRDMWDEARRSSSGSASSSCDESSTAAASAAAATAVEEKDEGAEEAKTADMEDDADDCGTPSVASVTNGEAFERLLDIYLERQINDVICDIDMSDSIYTLLNARGVCFTCKRPVPEAFCLCEACNFMIYCSGKCRERHAKAHQGTCAALQKFPGLPLVLQAPISERERLGNVYTPPSPAKNK